jgi:alpha-galactosidase
MIRAFGMKNKLNTLQKYSLSLLFIVLFWPNSNAQLAQTPPMGWNSWDCYGPTVTEDEVKANADYMAQNLKEFGWEYIVVDIRWYVENDKAHGYNQDNPVIILDRYGRLQPAVNRFPSAANEQGFKALAEYVHHKGLKFGIHIMRGIPKLAVEQNTLIKGSTARAKDIYNTDVLCKWLRDMYTVDATKTGAQEYYNSLFDLYASWGVDYIKIDDLSRPYHGDEIELISKAINQCGRPIVLSTSPGETPIENAEHVIQHANLWRIIDDFWDNWEPLKEHFDLFEKWLPYMGVGHWPDGDMLPLGHIGLRAERGDNRMSKFTKDEQYTLMTLFSICKSPLMFGGDLPGNDEFTLSLLNNPEILEVNQHSIENKLLFRYDGFVAWTAIDPKNGDTYLALFNSNDPSDFNEQTIPVNLEKLGFNGKVKVRDLWAKKDFGEFSKQFSEEISCHGAALYRLSAIK